MTKKIFFWKTASSALNELEIGVSLAMKSHVKSLLILCCNQNNFQAAQLSSLLASIEVPICGGIYPLLIHHNNTMEQGSIIIGFDDPISVANFTNLSHCHSESALESYLNEQQYAKTIAQTSLLMFYDSLTKGVENFLDTLFEVLDHDITIAGGGAGHLDFIQKPCIFTNQGLLSDTIQLVGLPYPLNIGVAHGWQKFQGPFLVTEAEGQTIKSLNYIPAFEAYKGIIEEASDYQFTEENFFDIAKNFPIGIEDINHDLVVRDPIFTMDKHLQCLGNIPVNSMVYLLNGNNETLINSAEKAAIISLTPSEQLDKASATIVFDCISRILYMQDEFSKEISVIAEQCEHDVVFGVLSLGEIAKNRSGSIRLLNKSTVITSW